MRAGRLAGGRDLDAGKRADGRGNEVVAELCSAATDVESLPSPTSGIETIATVRLGLTSTLIGCFIWPVASARLPSSLTARRTRGAETSRAWTTTWAGEDEPGNAAWMRS